MDRVVPSHVAQYLLGGNPSRRDAHAICDRELRVELFARVRVKHLHLALLRELYMPLQHRQ